MANYQDKSVEFYDDYSARQEDMGINHRHLSIQRWMEYFGLESHHSVLELGCGIGTITQLLLQYLGSDGRVVAADISPKSIALAKERLKKYHNVTFYAEDALQLDLEPGFDFILLPDVLEHIPMDMHQALFHKLGDWLAPAGKLVIHIPHPHYLEWVHEYRPEELQLIDQPLPTHEVLAKASQAGLSLEFLQGYTIYREPHDYQILMFHKRRKVQYQQAPIPPGDPLLRRLKRKIKFWLRGSR